MNEERAEQRQDVSLTISIVGTKRHGAAQGAKAGESLMSRPVSAKHGMSGGRKEPRTI